MIAVTLQMVELIVREFANAMILPNVQPWIVPLYLQTAHT
jgi:hypothetical protein